MTLAAVSIFNVFEFDTSISLSLSSLKSINKLIKNRIRFLFFPEKTKNFFFFYKLTKIDHNTKRNKVSNAERERKEEKKQKDQVPTKPNQTQPTPSLGFPEIVAVQRGEGGEGEDLKKSNGGARSGYDGPCGSG